MGTVTGVGETMNAYHVLKVAPTATRAEIRAAYRARALELHPDRQRRADGTVPEQAKADWLELTAALQTALAATHSAPGLPVRELPRQRSRASGSPSMPRAGGAPAPARARTPEPPADPMLTLLTLPRQCRDAWTAEELEVWALTLVPDARGHLAQARRLVSRLGLGSERHRAAATAHVLLTLTLSVRPGRRLGVLAHRLPAAYSALERQLPPVVVDQLPPRASSWRPGGGWSSLPWRR